jgi:CheY-like chemotaxis protein
MPAAVPNAPRAEFWQDMANSNQIRILAVDDHADTATMMGKALAALGHDITTATSFADATRLCDEGQRFDLLLTDVHLSDGSGLRLLELIRHHCGPDVRGIVITGHSDEDLIRRAQRLGFDDYLLKPIHLAQLEKRIIAIAGRISLGSNAPASSEPVARADEQHLPNLAGPE